MNTTHFILAILFYVLIWAPFIARPLNYAIGGSVSGGDTGAAFVALFQAAIYILGGIPALWIFTKDRAKNTKGDV
jgi:hypothetical protein